MPNPARAGVLIYAKDLELVATFYERVLGARVLFADGEHKVLQTEDAQLILHAIPPHIADAIIVAKPPLAREERAYKPFFTVESLECAQRVAEECGGVALSPIWPGHDMKVRNICDPEGNILHLRENLASSSF